MLQAEFRLIHELNDFLAPQQRGCARLCSFNKGQSAKHLIEALGVPHTEIGKILVNGAVVDLGYQVQDGDRVEVYPLSGGAPSSSSKEESLGIEGIRFVLDNHLGKLAGSLRLLGFDCLYQNDYQDETLARIAVDEDRILLTRDRRLLMRKAIRCGYWVRSTDPHQQTFEVVRRYMLLGQMQPFRRCLLCNGLLEPVAKGQIAHRLEPLTRQYYHEFRLCAGCGQVYWKGSHYERLQQFLKEITSTDN